MGTVIDHVVLVEGGWWTRRSALRLAVKSARTCLERAGRDPHEVDLLINAGVYRDRNLGEPALAAMIQQDIDANPEDPRAGAHGTFSFDIANGTCGLLTGLQIVDGFLKSHVVDCALVVASDADPGHGMSEEFPFPPAGAALLCHWTDDDCGLGPIHWVSAPDGGESFNATVGLVDGRNQLRFAFSGSLEEALAAAAARAIEECLRESTLTLDDFDAIVAAPAQGVFRAVLAELLGLPATQITVADDAEMHTASLAAAFARTVGVVRRSGRILLVAAGAGITAGAGVYRFPPGQV